MMNRQLMAALLARSASSQSAPPAPMLTQPPMRDPVATMNSVGGGAGGVGGGGAGMLGGIDPMKMLQLQQYLQAQRGGVNPYTYGQTSSGAGLGAGQTIDSAGNFSV